MELEVAGSYGLSICVPPQIHMFKPNLQCDGTWRPLGDNLGLAGGALV